MIHEQAIFSAYGTLLRPIKIIILEAKGAHPIHRCSFLHFKDLEIGGTLCNLQELEGRINFASNFCIAVVAWLTDDQLTLLFITN